MQFRTATVDDIPALIEIRLAARENILTDHSKLNDAEESLTVNGKGWVCEADGRVVGFCIGLNNGLVSGLFVRDDYQKRDIGSRLLEFCLSWLRERGVTKAFLKTDPTSTAAAVYRRKGWIEAGMQQDGQIRFDLSLGNQALQLDQARPLCNKPQP